MSHTPHELHDSFPEHAELIHRLKLENAHFARLADEHHAVNRAVHRAETNIEPTDDAHMTDLRKTRMRLRDEIAAMLREAAG